MRLFQGDVMADNSYIQQPEQPKTPAPEMKRLDALVGLWRSEGQTKDTPSINLVGTDEYEWLPGGFFLIHRVDVQMGDEKIDSIEIIGGYDANSHTIPMHSYDNAGNVTTMQARVNDDGVWTFAGESARATLTIGADGRTMSAHWEQSSDGKNWQPWMDMTFTRIK
jgi:hypothetical protein